MINIVEKKNCCGCSACASICPKHSITMTCDDEGFLYPNVDDDTCVNCGLCEKVCNELHPFDKREPRHVLAAINKNDDIRQKSSSGGVFYILSEKIIKEGGVVFGSRFDENWQVMIDYAEDINGVLAFMGSKYVQARVENAYKEAKRFLVEGRKVLFSGTPCQVAGLHEFLRKPYNNLLTVDFICHGTPSPKVWYKYLEALIREGQHISGVGFRDKKNGWKNFSFNLRYNETDKTISMLSSFRQNLYMKAFLQDIILRPSCYNCKVRGGSSQSDITIADFWGVCTIFPEMDDDKGTSLVFINTDEGKAALDFNKMLVAETAYERIMPLNQACYRSPKIHPKRDYFFTKLDSANLFDLINECTKPTVKQKIKNIVLVCKSRIKSIICMDFGGGKKKKSHYEEKAQPTIEIPKNPQIISICFRCKEHGWTSYSMEIRIK